MPLEDSLTLIARSYEQYMAGIKDKALEPGAAGGGMDAPPKPPFEPPSPDVAYLLNLLADRRQLTIEELDKLIVYLQERRDKLMEAEGRRPPPDRYGNGECAFIIYLSVVQI
jgi:hypothetical protein